jgi:hypothetical protein
MEKMINSGLDQVAVFFCYHNLHFGLLLDAEHGSNIEPVSYAARLASREPSVHFL